MVRAGDDVSDDFRVLRVRNARLEHANYGCGATAKAVEANGFSDDRLVLLEGGGPETICENENPCCIRPIILWSNEPAQHRMQAHNVEIRATNDACIHFARLAQPDHGKTDRGEVSDGAQGFNVRTQILNFGNGKVRVLNPDTGRALPEIDQGVFIAIDQRLEQDAAYQSRDGGVGADTKRQRENHRQRQPWRTT